MISRDLSSPVRPVSLLSSEQLSSSRAPPIMQDTSAIRHTLPSSVPMPAVDAPVEPVQAGISPSLATAVPDVGSSMSVSSTSQLNPQPVSPDSVRSDGSFYNAADSPTGQETVGHHNPTIVMVLLGREGPFVAANPHPRIGNDLDGYSYRFTTYRDTDFAVIDKQLDYHFTTHGSWSGWGHLNLPAYRDGIPANGSGPCPG